MVVPNALGLTFDGVVDVQFGRVNHNFRGIFIQLQKLFDQIRIEDIISDDNFAEELF